MNVADSDDRDEELSEIQIAFNEGVKVGKYKGAKELIRTLQSLLLMPLSSDQDLVTKSLDELERIAFSLRINLRVRITAVSALNPNDRELHRLRLKGERDFIWRYDNIESEFRCRFAETFIKKYLEGLDPHGLEGQSEQIRRVVLELQQDLRLPVSSDDELQSTSLEDLLTLMADLKAEFAWKRRQSVGC